METLRTDSTSGLARRAVAGAAALIGGIAWTHSVAAVLRTFGPASAPLAAGALTVTAVPVALSAVALWPRRGAAVVAATMAGLVGAAVIDAVYPGAFVAALALSPVGAVVALLGGWLHDKLPVGLEEWATRRRLLAAVWTVAALAAAVQVGRLSTYMTDHDFDWYLSTRHPFYAKHECASAYFYAAELDDRGEPNVYDAVHYPGLNPEARPSTKLEGMVAEDPFQYAPQFLLWPRLAIGLTNDYQALRMAWFGLQIALFMGAVLGLAGWIGGRAGQVAAYGSPFLLASFPVLHNIQYGQFHFAAVALGLLAMVAFEQKRRPLGGALLAISVLSKLFPALLLIPLVVQRRWRDLAWTGAAAAVLTVATLAIVGPAPFVAFFDYHVPRLADGTAFAFGEAWPEVADLIVAANQGVFGIVTKLEAMGVPGMNTTSGAWINRLYGLALLGVTVAVGLRIRRGSRHDKAISWLAILGLGSLASTGAFGDYVPLTAVWLVSLLAVKALDRPRLAVALGSAAVLEFFLLGAVPIGDWAPSQAMFVVSALGALAMLAVFTWTLSEAWRATRSVAELRFSPTPTWRSGPAEARVPVTVRSRR